jgi:glutaryl-CoA dehydrogenase
LDFYLFDDLLTDEEREIRDRVRDFCDNEVTPIINPYWERGEFPFEIIPKLAELNIAGGTIEGYGCPGLSSVAVGLAGMELARGDGSIDTFFGVTSGLAMSSIYYCGSEEQKQRWLPPMARLENIGAFGLTEPYIGSDASHLQTRATRVGDRYILNGAKRWIGNATFADVTVIWARDDESGQVSGFLVEKGTPGFDTTVIEGKIAKRAVLNADITLTNCEIPESNRLVHARSFRDTANVLKNTRYGVAWEATGHAVAAFEIARAYALERQQFGRPIAGFQLIQQKLVAALAAARRGQDDRRASLARQADLRRTRATGCRAGAGDSGWQRHPAGTSPGAAFCRHGSGLHLRGHKRDQYAGRRAGDHGDSGDCVTHV